MRIQLVGATVRNAPFATELAFKRGFDRLGEHVVNYVDPSRPAASPAWDHSADAHVVFKWGEGCWTDLVTSRGVKIVYQPDDMRFPHIFEMMREMRRYCDYALTYDAESARRSVEELGYRDAGHLLLTADDELYRPMQKVEKDVDVCFVGSLSGDGPHRSRARMCQLVASIPGIRYEFRNGLYDIGELVLLYNRSKVVLNHATDVGQPFGQGYGYQCRHFEAGFTGACLLTNEVIGDQGPKMRGELTGFATFGSEQELVWKLQGLLAHPGLRQETRDDLWANMQDHHRPEMRAREMASFIEKFRVQG